MSKPGKAVLTRRFYRAAKASGKKQPEDCLPMVIDGGYAGRTLPNPQEARAIQARLSRLFFQAEELLTLAKFTWRKANAGQPFTLSERKRLFDAIKEVEGGRF